MTEKPKKRQWEEFYKRLQSYGRIYTFRDPNNACLFELRVNECYVLDYIVEYGPISVTDLAEKLGVHKSNASRIANALESMDLLKITAQKNDKRAVLLSATASGTDRQAEVKKHFVGKLSKVLKNFSAADIDVAMKVIATLSEEAEGRIVDNSGQG